MQHLRWTKSGRIFSHSDEGKPNTFTLANLRYRNVDVNGDGQEFSPYVVEPAKIRHGASEYGWLEDGQSLKHLGQTLISRSRIYIQRNVSGTWTDVPHGLPTRNIVHNYPQEGKCTTYLDFPNIQGYASGARFQFGIEVGGSDRQTYGFRLRSPVAGTFRLEWVLDIPENVSLAWIEEPTSKTDPTPIKVGGRIGQTAIRWSRQEAPFRSATVESDGQGGKILHLFLGPYTVGAMEWLTIYPDTISPAMVDANQDGSWENDSSYSTAYYGLVSDSPNDTVFIFEFADALAATVTLDSVYFRCRTQTPGGPAGTGYKILMGDFDPASIGAYVYSTAAVNPRGGTFPGFAYAETEAKTGAFADETWYFGSADTSPKDIKESLSALLTSYGDIASGNKVVVYIYPSSGLSGDSEGYMYPEGNASEAQLLITYTAGGGPATPDPTLPGGDVYRRRVQHIRRH